MSEEINNVNKGKINEKLQGKYANVFPEDQLFSVENSLETLIPWLDYYYPIKNKNILIFGTGLGGTTVACALNIGSGIVYGVDINEDAVNKTYLRAEAYGVKDKVVLSYVEKTYSLSFDSEYFDAVFVNDVIEHIVDERGKYIKETYRVLKKNGLLFITGTPNLIYAKDRHTTGLYFIPWLSSNLAYRYAIFRGKWVQGKNLDYAGRRGTTYWHIRKWLKGFNYEVLNLKPNFTSEYLTKSKRINSFKRKILFIPYKITEYLLAKLFKLPITSVMPYINHLFIIKK